MAETVFYDVDDLAYDSAGIDGVLSISIEDPSKVETVHGDDGQVVHHVSGSGEVIGTITVKDILAGSALSLRAVDGKDITCKVKNALGVWYSLTLHDAKTGGISGSLATPAKVAKVTYKASGFSLLP